MLDIEVLLTENQLAEEFRAALVRRYLAEKFFYWFPLSVKAWLDLCDTSRPYKNYSRSYQLVARYAGDIARAMNPEKMVVVSLGAGQGDKDLLILQALSVRGMDVQYRPVDSSQALLEIALARAVEAGFHSRGLKADIENPHARQALAGLAGGPRLYLLLGNTLGVIDPLQFLNLLGQLLGPQDRLLVDAEIFCGQETMAGYDNPLNRQFAFAPLASVGVEEGRDGALVFESLNGRTEGLHLVGKYFCAARPLRIAVAGEWLEFQAGEKIAMNSSCKYSPGAFQEILRQASGFEILREYLSDDARFLMVLAAPPGDP